MPNYKVVDVDKLDADLATLADSIRSKSGSEEELSFPDGMKEAVNSIKGREGMTVKEVLKTLFDLTKSTARLFEYAKSTNGGGRWCNGLTFEEMLGYDSTSKVTNMAGMFTGCWSTSDPGAVGIDPDLPEFDTSNVTNMRSMFESCSALGTIPWMNTQKVTNMEQFLSHCTRLSHIPELDTSNVTIMTKMFNSCPALKTIPTLNTSKVTTMKHMFYDCRALESVPLLNTSNVIDTGYMFQRCSKLTTIPLLNTSKVTDMSYMFEQCSALVTIPALDVRSVPNNRFSNFVTGCSKLTEVWIKNIKQNIQVGSGTSYGHLLTVDSLVSLIYELHAEKYSYKTLTVGTANLEKLANVYVKTIDITDEMRAEDDLVDKKLPFVVCESTDEGATQIITYAGFKKWYIK